MTTQRYISRELLGIGDRIREEQPVLWAILRSRGATRFIALLLGMPPKHIDDEVESLIGQGILVRAKNGTPQLDRNHDSYDMHVQVKEFYQQFELQIHKKYADAKWDLGHFSTPVSRTIGSGGKLKAEGATKPTEKQTELIHLIRAQFDTEVFKSIDFAKAQGYKGSTRATANYLNALKNKGLLESLGNSAHGSQLWQLTQIGVEWLETGRWEHSGAGGMAEGRAIAALRVLGGSANTKELAQHMEISRSGVHRQMTRYFEAGQIEREPQADGSNLWRLKR